MSKSREGRRIDEAYRRARDLKDALRRRARKGGEVTEGDFRIVEDRTQLFIELERNKRRRIINNL